LMELHRVLVSQGCVEEYRFVHDQSAGKKALIRPPESPLTPKTLRESGHAYSAGEVESRMGAVAWAMRQRSVSHPRSSNRTCGFPASGSPTGFIVRHTKEITDRKRHVRGVLSSFASRHSFL
jgi:hypothetical protein